MDPIYVDYSVGHTEGSKSYLTKLETIVTSVNHMATQIWVPDGTKSLPELTSSISRTKSQSLNVSCILLLLSSLNPLKSGVKLRMKM